MKNFSEFLNQSSTDSSQKVENSFDLQEKRGIPKKFQGGKITDKNLGYLLDRVGGKYNADVQDLNIIADRTDSKSGTVKMDASDYGKIKKGEVLAIFVQNPFTLSVKESQTSVDISKSKLKQKQASLEKAKSELNNSIANKYGAESRLEDSNLYLSKLEENLEERKALFDKKFIVSSIIFKFSSREVSRTLITCFEDDLPTIAKTFASELNNALTIGSSSIFEFGFLVEPKALILEFLIFSFWINLKYSSSFGFEPA